MATCLNDSTGVISLSLGQAEFSWLPKGNWAICVSLRETHGKFASPGHTGGTGFKLPGLPSRQRPIQRPFIPGLELFKPVAFPGGSLGQHSCNCSPKTQMDCLCRWWHRGERDHKPWRISSGHLSPSELTGKGVRQKNHPTDVHLRKTPPPFQFTAPGHSSQAVPGKVQGTRSISSVNSEEIWCINVSETMHIGVHFEYGAASCRWVPEHSPFVKGIFLGGGSGRQRGVFKRTLGS